MQGRLSDIDNGVIQEFPWKSWRDEFKIASDLGIDTMEWTLDQKDLYLNPLMTLKGQEEILKLSKKWSIFIPSITGDCFMQHPFWKFKGKKQESLLIDFENIIRACQAIRSKIIVIPLVDNGSLENSYQEDELVKILKNFIPLIKLMKLKIAFESDYPPDELSRFICRFDKNIFGINYDIGNSAALGFSPDSEFFHYGHRVINVHVKDRPFGGSTVPLGLGDANFITVFKNLEKYNYNGNYILQTARDTKGQHVKVIGEYFSQTKSWLKINEF